MKVTFRRPRNTNVAIVDDIKHEWIAAACGIDDYELIDIRRKSVNAWGLLRVLGNFETLRLRGLRLAYLKSMLDLIDPKLVITFNDNFEAFYRLKSERSNCTFVAIQNGIRKANDFLDYMAQRSTRPTTYGADVVFVHNTHLAEPYLQAVNTPVVAIGSVLNNSIPLSRSLNSYLVGYVSIFHDPSDVISQADGNNYEYDELLEADRTLLPLVLKWCKERGLELVLIPRIGNQQEKDFFHSLIPSENIRFLPRKGHLFQIDGEWKTIYEVCDSLRILVSTYSTVGFESLARGVPTGLFWARYRSYGPNDPAVGDPISLPPRGPFWTDSVEKLEVRRVLDYLANGMDFSADSVRDVVAALMEFDPGNSTLRSYISAVLREA